MEPEPVVPDLEKLVNCESETNDQDESEQQHQQEETKYFTPVISRVKLQRNILRELGREDRADEPGLRGIWICGRREIAWHTAWLITRLFMGYANNSPRDWFHYHGEQVIWAQGLDYNTPEKLRELIESPTRPLGYNRGIVHLAEERFFIFTSTQTLRKRYFRSIQRARERGESLEDMGMIESWLAEIKV